ncbi:MAG: hypothetical protein GPOALKHO_000973 [Sodalis sp.]|nr:MAG: hypothetical protein GPOALKHO_000973 [Sodalis sp.]
MLAKKILKLIKDSKLEVQVRSRTNRPCHQQGSNDLPQVIALDQRRGEAQFTNFRD